MRTGDMIALVDSFLNSVEDSKRKLAESGLSLMQKRDGLGSDGYLGSPGTPHSRSVSTRAVLETADSSTHRAIYDAAVTHARSSRAMVDRIQDTVVYEQQRADRFKVEIHKKFSIALACIIFMLIGAPLGLSIRRGGLGTVGALATGIFLFYWVTLVQGEKLADRGFLAPWVGMWGANIVMLALGLWLMVYVTMDLKATPPLHRRLLERRRR
jgi:lipopolysaccharide export system permease protein